VEDEAFGRVDVVVAVEPRVVPVGEPVLATFLLLELRTHEGDILLLFDGEVGDEAADGVVVVGEVVEDAGTIRLLALNGCLATCFLAVFCDVVQLRLDFLSSYKLLSLTSSVHNTSFANQNGRYDNYIIANLA